MSLSPAPWRAASRRLPALTGLLAVLLGPFLSAAPSAAAAPTVRLPFADGLSGRIIQGYNGGTHNGVDPYALDIVVANGATSGATVVSPVSGTVTWTSGGPRAGNGCATMSLDGGGYRLMLCHVIFDRALGRGERLSQGQRIGTVGPPGTVGNNGAAHVHLDLSAGGRGSVPFASGSGLPLGGVDLPPRGRGNDHGGTVIPAGGEAVAESRSTTGETSSRGAAPRSTALSGAAVVQDTDGCLNVRATPSLAGRVVACLPEGTRVSIVEGPESANGRQWYRLAGRGWAAGDYLQETG